MGVCGRLCALVCVSVRWCALVCVGVRYYDNAR